MSFKRQFLIPIIIFLVSCNQNPTDTNHEGVSKHDEKKKFSLKAQPEFEKQDVKKIVEEFAKNYAPKRSESLDSIPEYVVKAFSELRMINKAAHEKYVTLIFAKLYAEHLKCCRQSYIIATQANNEFDKDNVSMVMEFAKMSSYLDEENLPEIWTSGIIEKWLSENPRLLKHGSIEKYNQYIQATQTKITNGEYWGNKK